MINPKQLDYTRNTLMTQLKARAFPHGVERAIEIGVWRGEFSQQMCNSLSPGRFWGVDPYELYDEYTDKPGNEFNSQESLDTLYKQVNSAFQRINGGRHAELLREHGVKAAETFDDEFFDIVYLDADHKYEAVAADIKAWWPKVKKNGVLCGHDYIPQSHIEEFGVIPAVQEFLKENNLKFHITGEAFATWVVFKDNRDIIL